MTRSLPRVVHAEIRSSSVSQREPRRAYPPPTPRCARASLISVQRGNIGNARLQGLQTQLLDNSDNKYSIVLLTFYITYMLGSIPGTLLSKAIPPNYALGGGCLIWYVRKFLTPGLVVLIPGASQPAAWQRLRASPA
jgi:hypothetical protein